MTFTLGIPQLVYLAVVTFNLFYAAVHHGEQKDGKYSVWITMIATAIDIALMKWGGFF